ncbi:hypothetical protein MOV58_12295 (plasmid) [Staphylococcus hominis]|uniref:hypothetical protein n=1 Tax=Staphylococcus hominis TaxID=1290 RepID=UPI0010D7EC6E|nr:hypothetical protein [Staphylococcus hominis]TBW91158.1 hypothetical protein EQ808_09380 [Staphylococcus hominis]UNQ69259.1 hypothetical protein MOV58_12295 [Staphylococcus hominis]
MTKERKDTLDSKYKIINNLNMTKEILFCLSLLFSVTAEIIENSIWKYYLIICFILVLIIFFLIDTILTVWLVPKIENMRKTHLLSNSLDISLNDEKTKNYYNNTSPPSIYRLGLNVFENSLFSFEVSKKMLHKERCKVIIFLGIFIVLVLIRSTHIEVILFLVQFLFGTSIINSWLKLESYKSETEKIYNKCRAIYLSNNEKQKLTKLNLSKILDVTIEYEALKARTGVMLSTKIFNKINPRVSEEWEEIKKELKLK